MLTACETFEDVLRRIIRNPDSGPIAHIAAECLFAVRKLENALTASSNPMTGSKEGSTPSPAVGVLVIPPVDKEDL